MPSCKGEHPGNMGKGKSAFHVTPSITGQSELIPLPLKEASSRVEAEDPRLIAGSEYLQRTPVSRISAINFEVDHGGEGAFVTTGSFQTQ